MHFEDKFDGNRVGCVVPEIKKLITGRRKVHFEDKFDGNRVGCVVPEIKKLITGRRKVHFEDKFDGNRVECVVPEIKKLITGRRKVLSHTCDRHCLMIDAIELYIAKTITFHRCLAYLEVLTKPIDNNFV